MPQKSPELTCAEAAAIHGVSERRIQRLAKDGRIPGARQHAGVWFIPATFKVLPPPIRRKRGLDKIDV